MRIKDNKYVIYGAGNYGREILNILGEDNVLFFCDKNAESIKEVDGVKVHKPEMLLQVEKDVVIVVASKKVENTLEIVSTLNQYGKKYYYIGDVLKWEALEEANDYDRLNKRDSFKYDPNVAWLMTMDKYKKAGSVSSYFWQDLWAAQRIHRNPVDIHFDIGSRFDGFISHLLSFGQRVRMIDIRPLDVSIPGLDFVCADATNLDGIEDGSIHSLSALCSLEHFGLGRYGDPIDPEACFKCFDAIQRKLAVGGKAYISVPIGKEKLVFNAHRIFYPSSIVEAFNELRLIEFSACCMDQYEEIVPLTRFDDDENVSASRHGLFMFEKV